MVSNPARAQSVDITIEQESLSVTGFDDGQTSVTGDVTLGNSGNTGLASDVPMRFTLLGGSNCTGTAITHWTETFTGTNIDADGGTQLFTITAKTLTADICSASAACDISIDIEADYTQAIPESDDTNNTLCFSTTPEIPNLVLSGISQTPECSTDGNFTGISVEIANTGCSNAGDTTIRLVSDCGLTFADETATPDAGERENIFFPFSSGITNCSCNFVATIDPDNTVIECSGTDNTLISSQPMSVPDITIDNETLDIYCSSNHILSMQGNLTLSNHGCGPALTRDIPVRFTLFDENDCQGAVISQQRQSLTSVSLSPSGDNQTFVVTAQFINTDFCEST